MKKCTLAPLPPNNKTPPTHLGNGRHLHRHVHDAQRLPQLGGLRGEGAARRGRRVLARHREMVVQAAVVVKEPGGLLRLRAREEQAGADNAGQHIGVGTRVG